MLIRAELNESILRLDCLDFILNHFNIYLSLCHYETFSSQTHLRQVLCLVALAFLLFVDSRLEAFVDEREVPSRHESIPKDK